MTIDLRSRAAYTAAKARHRLRRRSSHHSPIVVFSMAKTSSSAVAAGLREAGFGDVYQVHDLDPAFLENEEREYRWSGRPWRIWDAQQLLRHPPTEAEPWRVVSIVRDPIAQTVSAFFQPGIRRGYLHGGTTVESLLTSFGDRFDRLPLRWFESHVMPALGIDVYAHDFDFARRYQLITTPTVRLLVLRCEDLAVAPAALGELVGDAQRPIQIPRVNVGSDKDYAQIYGPFISALRPSSAQLERAYSSRVVQHFYAPEEIDRFRSLWSRESTDTSDSPPIDDEAAR